MLVVTQQLKKLALITGLAHHIVQRLLMDGALQVILDPAGASWRKVTTEEQDQS